MAGHRAFLDLWADEHPRKSDAELAAELAAAEAARRTELLGELPAELAARMETLVGELEALGCSVTFSRQQGIPIGDDPHPVLMHPSPIYTVNADGLPIGMTYPPREDQRRRVTLNVFGPLLALPPLDKDGPANG